MWRFSWLTSARVTNRVEFYLGERTDETIQNRGSDVTHHVDSGGGVVEGGAVDHVAPTVTAIGLAELGEQLSSPRRRTAPALREMEQSLSRHGQLVAVVCSRQASGIEILDGFK